MEKKKYAMVIDPEFSWLIRGSVVEIIREEKTTWEGKTFKNYEVMASNGNTVYISSHQVQLVDVIPKQEEE